MLNAVRGEPEAETSCVGALCGRRGELGQGAVQGAGECQVILYCLRVGHRRKACDFRGAEKDYEVPRWTRDLLRSAMPTLVRLEPAPSWQGCCTDEMTGMTLALLFASSYTCEADPQVNGYAKKIAGTFFRNPEEKEFGEKKLKGEI